MKYRIENADGTEVIREFQTWRDVVSELIGNHYTNGSYSMCLTNGTRLFGLTKATGNSQKDSTPVGQITEWISDEQYNGTFDYSVSSFWRYWDYRIF